MRAVADRGSGPRPRGGSRGLGGARSAYFHPARCGSRRRRRRGRACSSSRRAFRRSPLARSGTTPAARSGRSSRLGLEPGSPIRSSGSSRSISATWRSRRRRAPVASALLVGGGGARCGSRSEQGAAVARERRGGRPGAAAAAGRLDVPPARQAHGDGTRARSSSCRNAAIRSREEPSYKPPAAVGGVFGRASAAWPPTLAPMGCTGSDSP